MPVMKCTINSQEGWKYGESGKCYTGENAKQRAIRQALAIGGGKISEDEDYIIVNDDIIQDDNLDFIPPSTPEGFPKEAKRILNTVYNEQRSKWVKEHPNDPENEKNKQLSAQIAWSAVEKAGFKKNKEGKWTKDELNENKKDNVNRFDVFDILESNMSEPFKITPEGYLKGRAIIANTGIQSYQQKDGTVLRELRTPEDVGSQEALDSFKNILITSGHPPNGVNADNAKEFQVGFTGSDVRFDGHAISIDMTITDRKTIDEIKQYGKYAISAGYNADIEIKSGYAFGNNEYNAVQKNIRANHVAVNVDRARAGDLARMKLRNDSQDAINIYPSVTGNQNNNQKELKRMVKIKLNDNVEFEVDERVEKEFNILKKDNEDLKKKLSDKDIEFSRLQADKDSNADKLKIALEDIEKIKKELPEKIKQGTENRIALIDLAVKNEIEIKKDEEDSIIRNKIILKAFPNAKLEDKNEDYLKARFDASIELLSDKNAQANKQAVTNIKSDKEKIKDSPEIIQKRRMKNLWKLTSKQADDYRNGNITDEIKEILDKE